MGGRTNWIRMLFSRGNDRFVTQWDLNQKMTNVALSHDAMSQMIGVAMRDIKQLRDELDSLYSASLKQGRVKRSK